MSLERFIHLKIQRFLHAQKLVILTSLHPKHLRLTGTFECIIIAGAEVLSVYMIYSGGNNNNNNREMVILSCLVVICDGLNSS